MQVLRAPTSPAADVTPEAASGTITRYDYGAFGEPSGAAFIVAFDPGSRTEWHIHNAGQFIYVLDGTGVIVTRDGDHSILGLGDVVVVPGGESHWHGALPETSLRHLTLSIGGSERGEPVDEETYLVGVRLATLNMPR